jgi:predicted RNase H-like HicB family nuclease
MQPSVSTNCAEKRVRGSHHLFRRTGVERGLIGSGQVRTRSLPTKVGPVNNLEGKTAFPTMIKYEIIQYWSEEDGAFIAEVPELPRCAAHGGTQQEALSNSQDAIRLWIDTAKEFGDPVPEPKGRRLIFA